jgi:hypothetical protein
MKAFLRLAVVSLAAAGALIHAGGAAAATPCWKSLLNDWYDGRIDNAYAIHCYQDALHHLPADVQTYSSAHDDILRALQSAVAKQKRAGHKVGPNTLLPAPTSRTTKGGRGSTTTSAGAGNGNGTTTNTTTTTSVGRKTNGGISGLADKLNPSSADSLPVPLLVLGGLAILLVAAGAAGLVAKQIQARRQAP